MSINPIIEGGGRSVTTTKPKTRSIQNPIIAPKPQTLPQSKMTAEQKSYMDSFKNALQSGTADLSQLQRYNAIVSRYGLGHQMNAEQVNYFNNYNKGIQSGTNDVSGMNRQNAIANRFGLKTSNINDDALRDLSIKALSGDSKAADFLKAMNYQSKSGEDLWKGFDTSLLDGNESLKKSYLEDNPFTDYSKNHDMNLYNQFNNLLNSNGAMSQEQRDQYFDITQKWGLDDITDPYYQQIKQLESDKAAALSAQDVSLNQGIGAQEVSNFEQFQQLQQMMSDRGIADSGIAADSYMRAQMGANANYQQAFADSAQAKSDIQSQYNNAIFDTKLAKQEYADNQQAARIKAQGDALANQTQQDKYLTESTGIVYLNGQPLMTKDGKPVTSLEYQKMSETQRHNLAMESHDGSKLALDVMSQQTERDKYMTAATGFLYANGKPLTMNGRPITTLDYQKMSEEQRHNLAVENMTANKNANDYSIDLGRLEVDRFDAQTKRDKALADVQLKVKDLEIKQGSLDLKSDQFNLKVKQYQDSVTKAVADINNKSLDKVVKDLQRQAKDYLSLAKSSKDEKVRKANIKKYNEINKKIAAEINKYQTVNTGK